MVGTHAPRGAAGGDRTRRAVGRQLEAMACDEYEVGVYDSQARRMLPRQLLADEVIASLTWLKYCNANGADIYVRPSGSVGLLLVDDVTAIRLELLRSAGLDPAAVVLTSSGNMQAWVRVSAHPIGADLATAAARELAHRFGGDLAAAKWRQYGRLAGFTNRKPKHRQADGRYPFVLFVCGTTGVAPGAAALLAGIATSTVVPTLAMDSAGLSPPGKGGIVCVLVEEYRRAVRQHCERYQVDDWSRLDWMVTHDLAVAHPDATAVDLAAAIAAASPRIQERHPGRVDKYALHTASKVLWALNSW